MHRRRRRLSRWLRWPATFLIIFVEGLLILVAMGWTMLAWRAADGPIDISFLLPRVERLVAAADPHLRIAVDHAVIGWQGFAQGPDAPGMVDAARREDRGCRASPSALGGRDQRKLFGRLGLHRRVRAARYRRPQPATRAANAAGREPELNFARRARSLPSAKADDVAGCHQGAGAAAGQ